MDTPMAAETVTIAGHNGDEIEAYFARPTSPGPHPGVVVIHHMPGYDRATKEIVRTFAVYGYSALCPNLFHRYAPGAKATDGAAAAIDAGGVPDDQCVGDVRGAADYLRALPTSNGRVGVIGYCSGGRQAYVVACSLELDAAVDCYGGRVVATPEELTPAAPGRGHRSHPELAVPAARPLRRERHRTRRRSRPRRSKRRCARTARSTSSTRSRTRVTRSSPSIGPTTTSTRRKKAGS